METVSFEDTGCFSSFFLDYINQDHQVKPFVNDFFSKEAFDNATLDVPHRKVLVESIKKQYLNSGINPPENIFFLLDENTHTVTTGHQLCLFTGPLYFHYKIMSIIKLADSLTKEGKKVIPIFWMASEDHDFEEINHFHIKEKTYRWHSNQKGAVGEFLLDDMDDFLNEIPEEYEWMKNFYRSSNTLSEATRKIVHYLYGDKGIVILDANRPELKSLFFPVVEDELLKQTSFNEVLKTNKQLQKQDYKVQVNPREINLFYKEPGLRERILKTEAGFKVNNTDLFWTTHDFLLLAKQYPERISPNVVLRPVYQQMILPNLAYVGGPGELIYWLQLKSTHDSFGIHFPALVPRDHVLFLEKPDLRKIGNLDLILKDLFIDLFELSKGLVGSSQYNVNIEPKQREVFSILNKIQVEITEVDVSLREFMEAEKKRFEKEFTRIKKKVNKAVARIEEDKIDSLKILMSRVQPNGTLQERRSNFLEYYLFNPKFLNLIFQHIDPFNVSFKIVIDE